MRSLPGGSSLDAANGLVSVTIREAHPPVVRLKRDKLIMRNEERLRLLMVGMGVSF